MKPRMNKRLLVSLAWLCSVLLALVWVGMNTRVSSDLTLFMPKGDTALANLMLEELRKGPPARVILVAIEGDAQRTRAAISQNFAQRLRESGLFVRVENGQSVLSEAEREYFFKYRYLLSPKVNAERFSAVSLRALFEQRLRELGSPLPSMSKNRLPSDPSGEFAAIAASWNPVNQPKKYHGVWFSPDGRRALLMVETKAAGFDIDAQEKVVTVMRQVFNDAKEGAAMKLTLSGPGVFSVMSRDEIRSESQAFSLVASLSLLVFLFAVYRSARLVLLSALPLISAVLAGIICVMLLFDGIHGITIAFGVTLLGVAIDYPLHLFSHLHGGESTGNSLRRIWPTMRLGVLTTVTAYVVMTLTQFEGLSQLGVFAIAGLLSAAAVTRWVLPSMIGPAWAAPRDPGQALWIDRLLNPGRAALAVMVAIGLAALLSLLMLREFPWENNLAALSPIPDSARQLDRQLRSQLGAFEVRHVVTVVTQDEEQTLQVSETLAKALDGLVAQDQISGYEIASRYLPSQRTQLARRDSLPPPPALSAAVDEALLDLPFKHGLFDPFRHDVEDSRSLPALRLADIHTGFIGLRVSSLFFQRDNRWVAVAPLAGVRSPEALSAWFAENLPENVYYMDLKVASNDMVQSFRQETLKRVAWGGLVIVVMLLVGLRSVRRVLAVLVPLSLAVATDLAALVWMGERLSLFHLISLLLVVGIGIDYSLFFSRPDTDPAMRRRTFHALVICGISTTLVFGILALSQIPVLKAIGATTAIGVVAAFLMSMVFAQRWRVLGQV